MRQSDFSPTELTYHSFRHSQGSLDVQGLLLRYLELETGIEPDFSTDSAVLDKYINYITMPTSNAHLNLQGMNVGGTGRSYAESTTRNTLRNAAAEYYAVRATQTDDKETINYRITQRLLAREIRILDQNNFWKGPSTEAIAERKIRLHRRIKSGMASFIIFHGRDKRTTGFESIDTLYETIWHRAQNPLYLVDAATKDRHEAIVHEAEVAILGPDNLIQSAA